MKERVEIIHLPFIFDASAFPKVPEPKPTLPEDIEKLNVKVKELELENTELRNKMNRTALENQKLKDERKGKAKELEDRNKRSMFLEDQKDDLDQILIGSTSVIQTKKEELKKDEYRIQELERMMDRFMMEKKEIKLDFEAQICELKETLKKCKDKFAHEVLRKEAEGNCLHLEY